MTPVLAAARAVVVRWPIRNGATARTATPIHTAGDTTDMAFMHCPFRELAEAYPELVCNLHRGISEGIVAEADSACVSVSHGYITKAAVARFVAGQ